MNDPGAEPSAPGVVHGFRFFYPKRGLNWEQNWEQPPIRPPVSTLAKRRNPRFLGGFFVSLGAGEETRTLDLLHGKASMADVETWDIYTLFAIYRLI